MKSVFNINYTDNCPASSKEFNDLTDSQAKKFCSEGCSVDCTKIFKQSLTK